MKSTLKFAAFLLMAIPCAAQVQIGNGGSVQVGANVSVTGCGVSAPCTTAQGGTSANTPNGGMSNLGMTQTGTVGTSSQVDTLPGILNVVGTVAAGTAVSAPIATLGSANVQGGPNAVSTIIYDDDCMSDADCFMTLTALHHWIDTGETNVLAMVADAAGLGAPVMYIYNTYYGHSVPIGAYQGGTVSAASPFTNAVAQFDPGDTRANYPDCVVTLRTALAGSANSSVTYVGTGYANCLTELLASGADSISSLTGVQLVKAKISKYVQMGGDYPTGSEYNFIGTPAQWNTIFSTWTTANGYPPIYLVGATAGNNAGGYGLPCWIPLSHPTQFVANIIHPCEPGGAWGVIPFDVLAVYYGIFGNSNSAFTLSASGTNTVNGSTGANSWSSSPASGQYYLSDAQPSIFYESYFDGFTFNGAVGKLPARISGTLGNVDLQCTYLHGCILPNTVSQALSGLIDPSWTQTGATMSSTMTPSSLRFDQSQHTQTAPYVFNTLANNSETEGLVTFAPNMSAGYALSAIKFGVMDNTYDRANMYFNYIGDGSNINNIGFGFYGTGQLFQMYAYGLFKAPMMAFGTGNNVSSTRGTGGNVQLAWTESSTANDVAIYDAIGNVHDSGVQVGGTGSPIFGVVGSNVSLSSTQYTAPGVSSVTATETSKQTMIPESGTLSSFYLFTTTAQPSDAGMTVTVRVAGADTALTFTIPANAAAGTFSDLTHSMIVTAGQTLGVKFVNSSTSASAVIGGYGIVLK